MTLSNLQLVLSLDPHPVPLGQMCRPFVSAATGEAACHTEGESGHRVGSGGGCDSSTARKGALVTHCSRGIAHPSDPGGCFDPQPGLLRE